MPDLVSIPGVVLAALVEPQDARRAELAAHFAIADSFATVQELLLSDVHVDGAVVLSPHVVHFDNAILLIRARLHVLVEKPFVVSTAERDGPADARALAAAAAERGVRVLVNTPMNYGGACARAAAMVREGCVGEVEHVVCHIEGALRDLMSGEPLAGTEGALSRPPPSTWADPSRAGGYAWGQLSHLLSWVFAVSGLRVARASCFMRTSPSSGVDVYDAACFQCTNGATLSVSGVGALPKQCRGENSVRIFGTQGRIEFSNGHGDCSQHGAAT